MFIKDTAVIIPTRNRAKKLNSLLKYFVDNKIKFKQFIIVDSSEKENKKYNLNYLKKLKIKILNSYPSAAHQRNIGIQKVRKDIKFILFLDDDIVFYKRSFFYMNITIKKHYSDNKVVGFAFNLINKKKENYIIKAIKNNYLLNHLSLYSSNPGKILKSGWHSRIENLKRDTFVEWMYSGATIYKSKIIKNERFNTSLGSYSYLEDLFFSYGLFRNGYKLLISSNARFGNPNYVERSNFKFGVKEIINRYKFVKKFKLNKKLFLVLFILRFFKSLSQIFILKLNYFSRSMGNLYAILIILLKKL